MPSRRPMRQSPAPPYFNLRNLFMKKLTRDRVVPIISASVD
jgi:hypothetical protein